MSEQRLFRRRMKFERDYTQVPNRWLRDERLTYRARGVLAMLLSHDSGWRVTLRAITSASPRKEGIDAMRTAVNELEQLGYLTRIPASRGGRFQPDDWELSDPWEAVDNLPLFALDEPTRNATALDEPTRTALDEPTTIEDQVEERSLPSATTERLPTACGERPFHEFLGGRFCERCGLDPRTGEVMDFMTGIARPRTA